MNFVVVTHPEVPVAPGSIDGMFSCEVFQHFTDFGGIALYLQSTFIKLKPGGTICFQIPVAGVHPYSRFRYLCRRAFTAAQRAAGWHSIMDYRFYRATRVFRTLRNCGYKDCELRMFGLADHEDGHAYFFARKPANETNSLASGLRESRRWRRSEP